MSVDVFEAIKDRRVREILKRRGVDVSALDALPPEVHDEPADRAEIEARAEALRAAKRAKTALGRPWDHLGPGELDAAIPPRRPAGTIRRCPACATALGPDGVCRSCSPAAPAVPGLAPRMRRPAAKPLAKCLDCGGRLNSFNGLCPRCGRTPPTAYDLKPVRLVEAPAWEKAEGQAPEPDPRPPTPDPRPEGPPVPSPAPTNGRHAPPTERPIVSVARNGGRPCPTCGEPTNEHNSRCYRCRPGGKIVRLPASADAPTTPPKAPCKPAPAPPPAAIPAVTPGSDVSRALDLIDALDALDLNTFNRLVALVARRKEAARA